jgi:molecular chaperone DnaK
LVYATEKTMSELSDKVSADVKGSVNTALEEAKKALEANDGDAMKSAFANLEKVSHKLSEEAYKKAAAQGAEANGAGANGAGADKEDVVDADFEEVQDNK